MRRARKTPMLKFEIDGKPYDLVSVPIDSSAEQYNTYHLQDGTTLRVRLVMMDVLKAEGAFDQEGNPIYLLKSQNVVTVIPKPKHK